MEQEIWRDIAEYEGIYQVSNIGNVRSLDRTIKGNLKVEHRIKGRILRQIIDHNGYSNVCLLKNGDGKTMRVHRLVANAFIPNTDNKPQVNHIDGVKTNNKVENLEWVTNQENIIHAHRTGLAKITEKQRESARKNIAIIQKKKRKWVVQLDPIDNSLINVFPSIKDANKAVGENYHSGHIVSVCKGNREFSHGYKWQYFENYITGNFIEYKGISRKYPESRNRALTVQEREDVAKQYLEGMKTSELMKKYGVSKATIRTALKINGVSPDIHRGRIYDIKLDVLLEELKQGKSNKELAEKYHCPPNLIGRRKYLFRKEGKLL